MTDATHDSISSFIYIPLINAYIPKELHLSTDISKNIHQRTRPFQRASSKYLLTHIHTCEELEWEVVMYGNHRFRTEEKGNSLKWSRKSIIFSPFSYRASCFPGNISRHANKVSLFYLKKRKKKTEKRVEDKKFFRNAELYCWMQEGPQDAQYPFLNQIFFLYAHSKLYCCTFKISTHFVRYPQSIKDLF